MWQFLHQGFILAEIKFDRTPYKVQYFKDGQRHVIKRIPPPKLHDMLPEDEVKISRKKGDNWDEGDKVKIKHITSRHPNTLQVEDKNGNTTFLDYMDLDFKPLNGDARSKNGKQIERDPIGSKYLLWP